MGDSLVDEATDRSVDLLHRASRTWGFAASPDLDQYDALWVRDAAIAALGALTTAEDRLQETATATARSVAATYPGSGPVPAVIRPDDGLWDWGEGGSVDASAWHVITSGAVWEATRDRGMAAEMWDSVAGALRWLGTQDVTGSGLISAAPSTDWMDSSLVRSGRTLHLNVLYAWAARSGEALAEALGREAPVDARDLRRRINTLFWPDPDTDITDLHERGLMHSAIQESHRALAAEPRSHYVSHVVHACFVDRCDSLANILSVLSGVATEDRARAILEFLSDAGVDRPYPSRTWDEPIVAGDPMWIRDAEKTMNPRWHNEPHCYHNGGVWPYVGGLHAAAAASAGMIDEAAALLHGAAEANRAGDWRFSEWLHGETGKPEGASSQAWNAGALLLADAMTRHGPNRFVASF